MRFIMFDRKDFTYKGEMQLSLSAWPTLLVNQKQSKAGIGNTDSVGSNVSGMW